jgi:DNA repair protein RecN (Recombination protein N)
VPFGHHVETLKLPVLTFEFTQSSLGELGRDMIDVILGNSRTDTLSGGEFNRLRLALMASSMPQNEFR